MDRLCLVLAIFHSTHSNLYPRSPFWKIPDARHGPVFYSQVRGGRFGKPFVLYIFRSMAADAEAGGNRRWVRMNIPYGVSTGDARERLSYELYYAKNQSAALHADILLSTGWAGLCRDGAG